MHLTISRRRALVEQKGSPSGRATAMEQPSMSEARLFRHNELIELPRAFTTWLPGPSSSESTVTYFDSD